MISSDELCRLVSNGATDNRIKWNSYVDTDMAATASAVANSYPYVTYDIDPRAKDLLNAFIDKRIDELKKRESKTTNPETKNNNKKENNMNNTIKNVLFLAPGYNYAKTVVTNQSKELDRKKIPYNASTEPQNFYIHTDKVHIEIVYMDPIKWTPDLFYKRDAVFGKNELVDKALEMFHTMPVRRPKVSLNKYIREAHAEKVDPTVADVKPRETYIPEIKNAYFNNPMTVVIWEDGTKTMVRCQEGDVYSAETGLALCIAKKALGNMPNFNNVFKKWIPEELQDNRVVLKVEGVNFAEAIKNGDFLSRFKDGIQRALGHEEV